MRDVGEGITMRRSFTIVILLALSSLIVTVFASCRDDLLVEPPPSVIGAYFGVYTLVEVENGIDTIDFRSQFIDFTFTSSTYRFRWDGSKDTAPSIDTASSNIQYFCDSDGDYGLESGVQLEVTNDNVNPTVCTVDNNPEGSFSLNQGDTVRIIQVEVNSKGNQVTKILTMVLKPGQN